MDTPITITREGDVVKFTNCPPEFEIPAKELQLRARKPADMNFSIDDPKVKKFNEFYQNIINEKDANYVAIMFEIVKAVRTRSVRFVKPVQDDDYNIGTPSILKKDIREYIYKKKGKPFSFFNSTYLVRHSVDGSAANTKKELNKPYAFTFVVDQDMNEKTVKELLPSYLKSDYTDWADYVNGENLAEIYNDVIQRAWKIIDFIDSISVVDAVAFSAFKGFHIHLDYETLVESWGVQKQETYKSKEIAKIYRRIEKQIVEKTGVTDIGHGGRELQQIRSFYTLHPVSNLIALPMTREQLENFNINEYKIENVMQMHLRDRGVNIFG